VAPRLRITCAMSGKTDRFGRRAVLGFALGAPAVSAAAQFTMNAKRIGMSDTSYSQALLVEKPSRILFVSGQVPSDANGNVPESFTAQCRLVWHNIASQLAAAEMSLDNVVKITTFLADRRYRAENTDIRHEVLGARAPAITVVIADLLYAEWLLEIEAVACA
jgi:2-iminobutanoate/2-iminopropanoate deaminase